MMKKLLLLTLLVSSGAWANCGNLNGSKYSKCIDNELIKSKNELKNTLNSIYPDIPKSSKEAFSSSQKAWLRYRELECNYQLSLNASASDAPTDSSIQEAECIIEMNSERVTYLKSH